MQRLRLRGVWKVTRWRKRKGWSVQEGRGLVGVIQSGVDVVEEESENREETVKKHQDIVAHRIEGKPNLSQNVHKGVRAADERCQGRHPELRKEQAAKVRQLGAEQVWKVVDVENHHEDVVLTASATERCYQAVDHGTRQDATKFYVMTRKRVAQGATRRE